MTGPWAMTPLNDFQVDRIRQAILAAIVEAGVRGCDEHDLAVRLRLPSAVINARIRELVRAGYLEEGPASWIATDGAPRCVA